MSNSLLSTDFTPKYNGVISIDLVSEMSAFPIVELNKGDQYCVIKSKTEDFITIKADNLKLSYIEQVTLEYIECTDKEDLTIAQGYWRITAIDKFNVQIDRIFELVIVFDNIFSDEESSDYCEWNMTSFETLVDMVEMWDNHGLGIN